MHHLIVMLGVGEQPMVKVFLDSDSTIGALTA
jgi:hypothetical protein